MHDWWSTAIYASILIAVLVSFVIIIIVVTLPSTYSPYDQITKRDDADVSTYVSAKPSVTVVVLGDIGHSPRMQYHASSIAAHGGHVTLVGYVDSDIPTDIANNTSITIVPLSSPPANLKTSNKAQFPLFAILKVLFQTWSLYFALSYKSPPTKFMLVQNPPSIPTLLVALVVCHVRNTDLIIDWHNFAHTLLGLKLGDKHPLVRISEVYERLIARYAHAHFTVTKAMARVLKRRYGINATPLYDRPARHFVPLSEPERSTVLHRLPQTAGHAHGLVRQDWRLVVSATSWTPDEDFSVLLDALVAYSATVAMDSHYPKLLVVITGKGPLKSAFEKRVQHLHDATKLVNVRVTTAWLSMSDYAALLGAADLGVSLHTSSSGVDLPMKVLDMFGCGLPVIGYDDYQAWSELVQEGSNGKGFRDASGLTSLLEELFAPGSRDLVDLRIGATKEGMRRWDDEWTVAAKLLNLQHK